MNGAYITFAAQFVLDKAVAEKVDQLGDLVNQVTQNSTSNDTEYNDEYVVGSGGQSQAAKDLNAAIKAANDAIAGDEKTINVPIDEYETNENGEYVYYDTDGEVAAIIDGEIPEGATMKQLTVDVTYIEIDLAKIEDAIAKLNAMLIDPKYQNIDGFTPSSAVIPAGEEAYKSVTIAYDGTYRIEISGASGGHVWTKDDFPAFGGKGGHIIAEKKFKAGDVLKVRVGKEGSGTARLAGDGNKLEKGYNGGYSDARTGGWPNGGNSVAAASGSSNTSGGSGGGATEVYYAGSYGTTDLKVPGSSNALTRSDLILVAGGGGGAASANAGDGADGHPGIDGGDAGSLAIPAVKRNPIDTSNSGVGKYYFAGSLPAPYDYIPAGSLTLRHTKTSGSGGAYSYGSYATDSEVVYGTAEGQGATGVRANIQEPPGGGGGGYYGGNAIRGNPSTNSNELNTKLAGSGGGGSNYVKEEYSFNVAAGSNSTLSRYGNGAFSIEYVPVND